MRWENRGQRPLIRNPFPSSRIPLLVMLAIAVLVMSALSSCAMTQLPKDATPEQRREAMCQDAQLGLATVAIGMSTATTPAQQDYWDKYLSGAQRVHDLYCPSMSKLQAGGV